MPHKYETFNQFLFTLFHESVSTNNKHDTDEETNEWLLL